MCGGVLVDKPSHNAVASQLHVSMAIRRATLNTPLVALTVARQRAHDVARRLVPTTWLLPPVRPRCGAEFGWLLPADKASSWWITGPTPWGLLHGRWRVPTARRERAAGSPAVVRRLPHWSPVDAPPGGARRTGDASQLEPVSAVPALTVASNGEAPPDRVPAPDHDDRASRQAIVPARPSSGAPRSPCSPQPARAPMRFVDTPTGGSGGPGVARCSVAAPARRRAFALEVLRERLRAKIRTCADEV